MLMILFFDLLVSILTNIVKFTLRRAGSFAHCARRAGGFAHGSYGNSSYAHGAHAFAGDFAYGGVGVPATLHL
jgi:hypothetical protein